MVRAMLDGVIVSDAVLNSSKSHDGSDFLSMIVNAGRKDYPIYARVIVDPGDSKIAQVLKTGNRVVISGRADVEKSVSNGKEYIRLVVRSAPRDIEVISFGDSHSYSDNSQQKRNVKTGTTTSVKTAAVARKSQKVNKISLDEE